MQDALPDGTGSRKRRHTHACLCDSVRFTLLQRGKALAASSKVAKTPKRVREYAKRDKRARHSSSYNASVEL